MTRRTLLGTAAAPLLRAQRPRRPNLLFILTDSWRGQALPASDPNPKLPHLERLAREGADCRRTYTSYAVCCPSRAAILTGRFPRAAGVTLGWLVGRAVNFGANIYIQRQGGTPGDLFSLPFWLIGGAIGFSWVVSLLAGSYPASRAARLDPIQALRHD